MELNTNVNTFYKGLDLDSDVSILEKNTIRYAENIKIITDDKGTTTSLQNADFIQKLNIILPNSKDIVIVDICEAIYCNCTNDSCVQKECGVVFTLNKNDGKNYVYTIDFDNLLVREVIIGKFGWNDKLSLVSNFESCDVSNVYIADGINTLRKINIAKKYGEVDDITIIDMIPNSHLNAFEFNKLVSGRLQAGKYQYAYQLFQKHGGYSALSAISNSIPISTDIGKYTTYDTKGSKVNTVTNKGISLTASLFNKNYDYIRIFRIFYKTAGQLPEVHIIDEFENNPSNDQQTINYVDYGKNPISVITIDELNQYAVPYDFSSNTLEIKDNLLFAANITENTWDPEFDARAYRADKDGIVVLQSSSEKSIQFDINEIPDIKKEHDCLNPSNLELFNKDSFKYVYNKNGILGGTGLNVSYEFVFTEVILSSAPLQDNKVSNILSFNASTPARPVRIYNINNKVIKINQDSGFHTYADPDFCSRYVGYQRDEIYRFGIVFYNEKNIVSPVHWIGDIRIPGVHLANSEESVLHPFHFNKHIVYSSIILDDGQNIILDEHTYELMGYAVGLKFDIQNLPKDVVGYQIVRCSRDEANRTIITQAIASSLITKTGSYANWLHTSNIATTKTLFPQFIFNMSDKLAVRNNNGDYKENEYFYAANDYLELVSPEICVDSEYVTKLSDNAVLCHNYNVYSYVKDTETGVALAVTPRYVRSITEHNYSDKVDQTSDFPFYVIRPEGTGGIPYLFTGNLNCSAGISGVFKYYLKDVDPINEANETKVYNTYQITSAIAPRTEFLVAELKDACKNSIPIYDKVYSNISIAASGQWGWHGKNIVVKINNAFEFIPINSSEQFVSKHYMNNAGIFNMKKPSSMIFDSYHTRQNSIYIGCGGMTNSDSIICYGGDTYLTIFDYLNTSFSQSDNDFAKNSKYRIHTQCFIPFETTVNTNLFHNVEYHEKSFEQDPGYNLIQTVPVVYGNYSQDTPLYQYNAAYSQDGSAIKYIPKLVYAIDDQVFKNRIIVSETKTNLEIHDSWLIFKIANYLDVNNEYGNITNLKNFQNKLYFFQDNALGIASVNDRSLIVDNINELTLGSGGILSRFDYVLITNGSSVTRDKSIVNSATSLYWYDFNKNTICSIGGINGELSKIKKVQSYYNNNYNDRNDYAKSFFNKKYNEIWFKTFDKPLIYNESIGAFNSFNTHDFDHCLTFGDRNITIKNDVFYVHNDLVNEDMAVEPMISKLHIVVNDNFMYTKTFDNVMFYADFKNNINNITSILFSTKTQDTLKIDANDIECREDDYRFAIPRESQGNTGMSYAGRMRGKYLEEFYTFDCTNNKTFKIPYIKTTYRQSRL